MDKYNVILNSNYSHKHEQNIIDDNLTKNYWQNLDYFYKSHQEVWRT